ncbi:TPA: DNA cytosine methyltransferase [Enterobacter hormaechei subsp. xiangfangensis]|nr:DNA cytosine methyltransferase [Enterobacter hormaechei subsp. xiangfangensis]HBM2810804.1 DNA cytosine methyltransferase [Enterobacter hormaechei subsp. xiangfangensis]
MNKPVSYGSVCSGIEAASVAWHCLGWQPAWFAEIEKFPSAVLAYRWPDVSNLGDMTQIAAAIRAGKIEAPDVLVGGTPCQAFSVAGLRNGLADERGQLTLAFVELVNAIDEKRTEQGKTPVTVVWENVPGVFSSKDNAFGCFLAGLAGESCALESPGKRWSNAGYVLGPERAIAWRVLDAQFFGVAQRRRRVFVVATARGDIDPAKILFESEGLRRNSPPCRKKEKAVAALTSNGVGVRGADDNQAQAGHLIPECVTGNISHTLKAEGFDGSEDGTGRGTPIIAMAHGQGGADHETLAVHGTQDPDCNSEIAHTLGRNHGQENAVHSSGMAVRRLTPVECERLQGFPDNHTLIPTLKRKQLTAEEYAYLRHHRPELTEEQAYRLAADGPRYKAIGNSMAVPVMRWIGSRIQEALRA